MSKLKEPVIGMLIGKIGQVSGAKWNGISDIRVKLFCALGTHKHQLGNDTDIHLFNNPLN